MASFSSQINPNVVKTALDDVFFQEFDGTGHPGHASAMDSYVFQQDSVDSAADIQEIFKGVGYWEVRQEEQDVSSGTPQAGNKITHSVTNFDRGVDIPKNMFDDNKHNTVNRMIRDFADSGRTTRDKNAFAVYRNGFTTTLTADGSALFADAHTNLNGDTVDNKITAALSPTALETAIVTLGEQKAQDGTIRGHIPACLLVPMALFKEATEITESELISDSADNAVNWVSRKFGISVKTTPFLGAAAGGSDTAWFLLAKNHSITRWERQAIETTLVDWRTQRNNNYIYKGSFREVVGALTYEGSVGSDGSS